MDPPTRRGLPTMDIDHRMRELIYRVRWSPRQGAFVAFTEQYPGLTNADDWTAARAVRGLKEKLRQALIAGRLPDDRPTAAPAG